MDYFLVFLTVKYTLPAKIRNAPVHPEAVSTGSIAMTGPNTAASKIRVEEIIPPSMAVTYLNPMVIRYCPTIAKKEH